MNLNKNRLTYRYINKLLYNLYRYDNDLSRKIIIKTILKYDGGEYKSKILRNIYINYHDIDVGLYSYGCFNPLNFPLGTKIGRYCSFARNCALIPGNHPARFKSLHPYFYNPDLGVVNELKIRRTRFTIGHDVWIGTNAIVLPNASKIGAGSIIGAGSVVTRDVPPFAIVAGNPARILKYRFSEKTISDIIESKWWETDIDEIEGDQTFFNTFIKTLD
jgi:virginiamycin A acetyltransferase